MPLFILGRIPSVLWAFPSFTLPYSQLPNLAWCLEFLLVEEMVQRLGWSNVDKIKPIKYEARNFNNQALFDARITIAYFKRNGLQRLYPSYSPISQCMLGKLQPLETIIVLVVVVFGGHLAMNHLLPQRFPPFHFQRQSPVFASQYCLPIPFLLSCLARDVVQLELDSLHHRLFASAAASATMMIMMMMSENSELWSATTSFACNRRCYHQEQIDCFAEYHWPARGPLQSLQQSPLASSVSLDCFVVIGCISAVMMLSQAVKGALYDMILMLILELGNALEKANTIGFWYDRPNAKCQLIPTPTIAAAEPTFVRVPWLRCHLR